MPIIHHSAAQGMVLWPVAAGNNNAIAPTRLPARSNNAMNNSSANTLPQSIGDGKSYVTMLQDANKATVLEARKSLERNFLKSQQERQQQPRQQHDRQDVVEPIRSTGQIQTTASAPMSNTTFVVPQQLQQQQQVIMQQMAAPPSRYPSIHPFGSVTMNNNCGQQHPPSFTPVMNADGKITNLVMSPSLPIFCQQPSMVLVNNNANADKKVWIGSVVKPTFPTSISFPAGLAASNAAPQAVTNAGFLGTFPISKTPLVGNNHGSAAFDALESSTNYLMSPTPANNSASGGRIAHNGGAGQMIPMMPPMAPLPAAVAASHGHSHGTPFAAAETTPPPDVVESDFNSMLSNLLSTALPPSDELFDDNMGAGNISDCFDDESCSADSLVGAPLQVADDGMLLPP
eukprot:CAMPEP_0181102828 /NCGR_PEP_ID=MMETSP1071-20121207/14529_1 /TAXON_ID=35127 /ORGANISM="Thalassiosira sp., Strain NH16" /LENGTH=400 /DNA_ID=CAMNT_0023185839 /DNA_START=114 /DNA_END=1316 /DNA_ORIENTATION=-